MGLIKSLFSNNKHGAVLKKNWKRLMMTDESGDVVKLRTQGIKKMGDKGFLRMGDPILASNFAITFIF